MNSEKDLPEPENDNSSVEASEEESSEPENDNSSVEASEEESSEPENDNSSVEASGEESSEPENDNSSVSVREDVYPNRQNKTYNKGFKDFNKDADSQKYNSKILFESKNRESSATDKKNKFSDKATEVLKDWQKRYYDEIDKLKIHEEGCNKKIKRKQVAKSKVKDIEQEIHYEEDIDELNAKIGEIQQEIDGYREELDLINSELDRRNENTNRDNFSQAQDGKNQNSPSEENKKITAESLFAEDDLIKNTVLYVATFLPRLNPQDFRRIVEYLLGDKKKTIIEEEKTTNENGKVVIKEIKKQKLLKEIWEESFEKPDRYFKQCHLIVSRQNGKQGIDFTFPKLREDFHNYLENEQSFFLEKQLQHTRNLHLLLDKSENVADKAMEIAIKAAIDYPDNYAEKWLIELVEKIDKESKGRYKTLIERLSTLIYKLQINPKYSRYKNIAQSFLERLISLNYTDYAFKIFQYLTEKHLSSGIIGFQSAKQLMDWLKDSIDNEKITLKDASSLLNELLWNSGYNLYVYDFLEILKEWFSVHDIPLEKYSISNKLALLVLYDYCINTIESLPLKSYGKWYSPHPLFTPFYTESSNKINKQLDILFALIFNSNTEGENRKLAIKYIFDYYDINIDYIPKISFIIIEWIVILSGFDSDVKPRKEVLNLIDCLIQQIILNTSRNQQKALNDCWAFLTDQYLDLAIEYKESGNREFNRHFNARRKILKKFRKQFKSVQKEMKTVK